MYGKMTPLFVGCDVTDEKKTGSEQNRTASDTGWADQDRVPPKPGADLMKRTIRTAAGNGSGKMPKKLRAKSDAGNDKTAGEDRAVKMISVSGLNQICGQSGK